MICLPDGGTDSIEADVAIVGAGPVGMSLALALAAAGIRTVVIESGGLRPDAWATSLSVAAALEPPSHAPVETATNRRLGGASWTWGGRCVDFDPLDFESGRGFEAPAWPISHAAATAEAQAAAGFLGIGPPLFDEGADEQTPPGGLRTRLERWCADPRLAHAHAATIRETPMARFHLGLTCTAVELDAARAEVRALQVKDRAGIGRRVTARHYVVAAGGIETARLLLASFEGAGGGEAQRFGWLGRGYMGHLQGAIADLVLTGASEDALDYRHGEDGGYVRSRLMIAPDILRGEGLLNIAFLADNPPLGDGRHRSGPLSAAALALATPGLGQALLEGPIRAILLGRKLTPADVTAHLANIARDAPAVARFLVEFLPGRFARPRAPGAFVRNTAHRYALKYYAEQSPLRASQVTLTDQVDALGLRRVRVEKQIAERDIDSILRSHEILGAEMRVQGWARLEFRDAGPALRAQVAATAADGYHQIGLARMSAHPDDGVVDPQCRVHGLTNLHLAGSAVFPTSGQANPTYLAVCLALRLARHLIAEGATSARPYPITPTVPSQASLAPTATSRP